MAFEWKGCTVENVGQLVTAMARLESPEEAQEFRAAYAATNEHADDNLGYCTGYLDSEMGGRLREWLGARHPILGNPERGREPSAAAIFIAGEIAGVSGRAHAAAAVESWAAEEAVALLEQAKVALQQANGLGLPWQFRIARFERVPMHELPLGMVCDVDVANLVGPRLERDA